VHGLESQLTCALGAEAQAHGRRTEESFVGEDEGGLGEAEECR
jgi:hypothetical protein